MAIPAEFSEVEHLQSLIRRYLNKQVRDDFQDLGGNDWDPDVTTTRGAMRYGLTHKDDDPMQVTLARMFLYYFTYGKAQALQAPMFGLPIQDYQETFKYHPQVKLFFMEDADETDKLYYPIRSEITFRLMDETENTITEAKAKVIANRIKTNFCAGNGFRWKRGKETWLYHDMRRGYRLKLFVWNEVEAKRVIEQVLDIQQHTPDWDAHLKDASQRKHLKVAPPLPRTERIYGKNRKLPRNRPVGYVEFRYAELDIWGLPMPICLTDRMGTRRKTLVAA